MRLILATQATAAALLFSSPAANAAPMKVSGTFTGSCTMQDPHPLADAGKVLVSQICKAKNVGAPFDGDDVTFSQIIELDQGNGSQTGQNAILDSKGTTTNEYSGTIRTKMVDGQPRTTGSGTYKVVGATGVFTGGTGHGSYDLTFTSETDFVSQWTGVFEIPKRVGSR